MNYIASSIGHRDGPFQFSKAEQEDRLPPVGAPSFFLTAGVFLVAVAPALGFIAWWLS